MFLHSFFGLTGRFSSISLFAIGTTAAFGWMLSFYNVLLISASIANLNVVQVLRDVVIVLVPMLLILLLIIVFPEIALRLPKR